MDSFREDLLASAAVMSIEADIAFLEDPDERKSDAVDGAIGEDSRFHESFGIYGQGVSVTSASLPTGWKDRLVAFDDPEAGASKAVCLDPHDLVVSKLVAGREKDFAFARALLDAELVNADILVKRARLLPGPLAIARRVIDWIEKAAAT